MARRSVRYTVVDAFTSAPFKGNPAAVCLLEEEAGVDDNWMQNIAKEFNISETAFLVPSTASITGSAVLASSNPRFRLRWFTPVAEVKLCGHATLASAHFLFTFGLVKGDVIEFDTLSGILTTKKMPEFSKLGFAGPCTSGNGESFSIELDFPIIQVVDCVSEEIPSFLETLNDLSMVNVQKTIDGDLLVELNSGKDLADVKPNFIELARCVGSGVIMTAPAPPDSGFDFFMRFFCPKMGINEDPVTGSAHCALAPYWSKKLGKHNLIAYQCNEFLGGWSTHSRHHLSPIHLKASTNSFCSTISNSILPKGNLSSQITSSLACLIVLNSILSFRAKLLSPIFYHA